MPTRKPGRNDPALLPGRCPARRRRRRAPRAHRRNRLPGGPSRNHHPVARPIARGRRRLRRAQRTASAPPGARRPRRADRDPACSPNTGSSTATTRLYLVRLSFYPVGTVVELTDGRVGVVVANHPNPDDPRAPRAAGRRGPGLGRRRACCPIPSTSISRPRTAAASCEPCRRRDGASFWATVTRTRRVSGFAWSPISHATRHPWAWLLFLVPLLARLRGRRAVARRRPGRRGCGTGPMPGCGGGSTCSAPGTFWPPRSSCSSSCWSGPGGAGTTGRTTRSTLVFGIGVRELSLRVPALAVQPQLRTDRRRARGPASDHGPDRRRSRRS